MSRIINQLRNLYRLTKLQWTYDPKLGVWRNNEGWHVYATCIMEGPNGDDPVGTDFRRSDTGDRVPVVLESTELRLGKYS